MHKIGLLILSILLLFPISSYAGCSDSLEGESKKLGIRISDCDHSEMMILTRDFSRTVEGGVARKPVPMAVECTLSKNELTCRKGGKTPLAGSTYRYTLDTNPS